VLVRRWLDAAGVVDPVLRECYLHCIRDVARRDIGYAKLRLWLLPAAFRPYLAAAAAWGCAADDRADTGPVRLRRQRLDEWAEAAATALAEAQSADPVLHAAAHTWRVWNLPVSILDDMVCAMRRDTAFVEFATYEELAAWSAAMAGGMFSVPAFMVQPLGADASLVPACRELGALLQQMDLLCDLSDDLRDGRLYLPIEDLERFGVQADELRVRRWTPATAALLTFEVDRVLRGMRAVLAQLGQSLPRSAARAIGDYCELHLREVLANGPAVLHHPIRVSPAEALAVWLPHRLSVVSAGEGRHVDR
jgi:phytoene synthase